MAFTRLLLPAPRRSSVRVRATMEAEGAGSTFSDLTEQASGGAEAAMVALKVLKAPTRRQEAYRFSKLPEVLKPGKLKVAAPAAPSDEAKEAAAGFLEMAPAGQRIVAFDGVVDWELSDASGLAACTAAGLDAAEGDDEVAAMLGRITEIDVDERVGQGTAPLVALSSAVATDGLVLKVSGEVAEPLYLLNVVTGAGGETLTTPRLLVVAEEDSRLNLIEHHVTAGEGTDSLVNSVGKVLLKKGSHLEHTYLNELSEADAIVQSMNVTVLDGAVFNATAIQAGGKVARYNLGVDLDGVGGTAEAVGVQVTGPGQAHETYCSIVHNGEDCESLEQQRNVVAKGGEGVFKGRVHIGPFAAGTSSDQLCKTLLLQDGAKITALPTLEVINENVVAAHGATVADLDEESVFYMRSRGFTLMESRTVLMRGFVEEFMDRVALDGFADRVGVKVDAMAPTENRKTKSFFQSV